MKTALKILIFTCLLYSCTNKVIVKSFNYDDEVSISEKKLKKYKKTILETNKGLIEFEFLPEKAPKTVHRLKELIYSGFYNAILFHRVVPKFVIQVGDPTGTGTGGTGKKLKAEFNDVKHERGAVSMARAIGDDSADSQFFIVLEASPHLNGKYTVFGKLINGFDIIDSINVGDKIISAYLIKK